MSQARSLEFPSGLIAGRATNPWAWMIGVDALIMLGLYIYKVNYHRFGPEYGHLLATYHFGFTRRAFIGSVVGLFTDSVPYASVYILGLAVWLVTLACFVVLFLRTFGRERDTLALFAFLFGSPFLFKNFMCSVGYFDIYGCLAAIVLLLIPINRLYVALAALCCAVLVLIHHLHFLLYVPVIGFIVLVRAYVSAPITPGRVACGLVSAIVVCAVLAASTFWGDPGVTPEALFDYFRGRADSQVDQTCIRIFYSRLPDEIARTWSILPNNALRFPVYALLMLAHFPLIRFFRNLVAAIPVRSHRALVVAGVIGISFGYVIICAVVFDYSRWVSNFAMCMVLTMHAAALLSPRSHPPIPADDAKTRVAASIVTAIPRVGITVPF
jgi:hypothetical protein